MPSNRQNLLFVSNTTGYRVGRILQGVLQECRKSKLSLLWRESDQTGPETFHRPPHGAIVWDKLSNIERLRKSLGPAIPVVSTIGHTLDLDLPTVIPDPVSISRQVAGHLVEEGLRNFVFVGPVNSPSALLREQAFAEELKRLLGEGPQFRRFSTDFGERFWGPYTERGKAFIKMLRAAELPLGLFAFNDQIAASCLECADFAGLQVPQQVSIVGVDNHPIFTQLYQPLSSVQVDYEEIGRTAVKLILQMQLSRSHTWHRRDHHFVPGTLVVRQSSRPRLLGDPPISQVLHHLHAHFNEPVTLVGLAKTAGMSRASFALRFQRAVGHAPIRYLINLRLQQAKRLLAESALTVAEISYRVGFEDQGYFTRAFKKLYRTTPTDYRRDRAAQQTGLATAARKSATSTR